MSEVLTPGPGQTVVDTDKHHKGSGWDKAIFREQAAGFRHSDLNQAAIVAAVGDCSEESQENFATLQKQVSDAATATVVGFKDAQATAYQIEGRTGLDAAKNASSLGIQADKNTYNLQLQAQTFASAAALQAQTIASAAAAAAAECCCELKSLIRDDGAKTRDLISVNELANANRRTAKAEQMLAAYYTASKVPVVP